MSAAPEPFRAKPDDADLMARRDVPGGAFHVRVAAVVRDAAGRLLVERGELDELVGGRLNVGEAAATSLARELQEELDVAADVGPLLHVVEVLVDVGAGRLHELLLVFAVDCDVDRVRNAEGQELVWLDDLATLHPPALREALAGPGAGAPSHLLDGLLRR